MSAENEQIRNYAALIWSVADLLRGDYKQSEYGRVILPFTVLRRLDCVFEPVKADMLAIAKTERSIELLTEKRPALITAAVTGELEIPKAA